jgi:uncharacterized membrane protein
MARRKSRTGLVLGLGVMTTGLVAGLLYSFACAVLPGLANADDRTLVDAMQQINVSIENPVFFLTFLGAPVLVAWALVTAWRSDSRAVLRWVAAALVLYAIVIVVTAAFNIPLNDELANAGEPSKIGDIARVRDDFVNPWVAWNIVRTLAAVASLGCMCRALVVHARS